MSTERFGFPVAADLAVETDQQRVKYFTCRGENGGEGVNPEDSMSPELWEVGGGYDLSRLVEGGSSVVGPLTEAAGVAAEVEGAIVDDAGITFTNPGEPTFGEMFDDSDLKTYLMGAGLAAFRRQGESYEISGDNGVMVVNPASLLGFLNDSDVRDAFPADVVVELRKMEAQA